jgi:integrase
MAIKQHKRGAWYCRLTISSGRRIEIYLGMITKGRATAIDQKMIDLAAVVRHGIKPEQSVSDWLSACEPQFLNVLESHGLLRTWTRPTACPTVSQWMEKYLAQRTDLKPGTLKGWKTAKKYILPAFGDTPMDVITIADAKQFARDILSHGLKPSTAKKHVERLKQVFDHAMDSERIKENPFSKVSINGARDEKDVVYVQLDVAKKVMEQMTCSEMRLILALSRWCGVRIPHEAMFLRWTDVDWDRKRFRTDKETKTGERWIPMPPLVRELFEELYEIAPENQLFVFRRCRQSAATYWRTAMLKAIQAAGLVPWKKLFQNMRASCRTDFGTRYPDYVCNAWFGHSRRVAVEHYLMLTDDLWDQASAHPITPGAPHGAPQPTAHSGSERHRQET